MARQKLKTEATTLKMTAEVRALWEQCAEKEYRTLTSMFEVMVRAYAKHLDIPFTSASTGLPTTEIAAKDKATNK